MLKSRKGSGIYRDTLNKEARARYMDKIIIINGLDPYEIPAKEWSTDEDLLPQFCTTDLFGYLVCGVSAYTSEQFRSYKSLESHVQFTNGWVQELQIIKPTNSGNTVIRSKVSCTTPLRSVTVQSPSNC